MNATTLEPAPTPSAATPIDAPHRITGAEALVKALEAEGVNLIFGYPGGAIMPIYDALHAHSETLEHVLTRHEQGAIHAAEGYARTTGRVGVCMATSGPGATNFVTGLADAMMDSTPLVCITGQVFSALRGTDAFQESDVVGMTLGCTKWNIQIADAAEIPQAVRTAFKVATDGRPGPVLIDITKDAQFATLIDEDASKRAGIGQEGAGQVSAGQVSAGRIGAGCKEDHYEQWAYADEAMTLEGLDAAAKLINEAERPLMMVGQGVLIANASREARLFAERTGMPVASTLLGLSAIASDHPQYVGMLGMHGNYAPNMLTNKADVIVAVGMRFDDRVTGRLDAYAPNARIVHIEIDPAEVNKCVRAEVALIADARAALEALTPLTEHRSRDEWRAQFRALDAQEHEQVIHPDLFPADGPIKMGEVVNELSAQTDGRAIIVSDVGQHQMFAARYYQFREPDSHVSSGGLGTMGFALPAAIGAKMGNPEREVVAIIGDGGFQMTLQELGTIMQSGAAVKIIVLNNGYLGMVRQWQQLFFDRRYSHVEMASPNLVVLAAAYGIAAERCADRHALGSAIGNLLSSDGAALLEVCVGAEDNIFPMIAAGDAVDEIRLS